MTEAQKLNADLVALIGAVVASNPHWNKSECVAWAIDGICEQYQLGASDELHVRQAFEMGAQR